MSHSATHFFNDLVEMQVLYLSLIPGKEGNRVNENLIGQAANQLPILIPEEAVWAEAVRVIDPAGIPGGQALRLHVDALRQSAICYFDPNLTAGSCGSLD